MAAPTTRQSPVESADASTHYARETQFNVERVPTGSEAPAIVREKSTFMISR
ncbi:MAG TPA: hypothetical protein VGF12_03755 [Roseateles sp.]|uniref:hypothetical protein n=1 Tax=Roseateles sp. TaxID=1971397 RepID=UPI002ED9FD85